MTSLPEPTTPLVDPNHAGSFEGSECGLASLDPFLYQEMRWCERRGEFQPFVEMYEARGGRVGVCLGCGVEDAIPFTRETAQ